MNTTEETFPAADADRELHPGKNTTVEVDSVSAAVAEKKERNEAAAVQKEKERKDAMETLKYTIIVSGITVAVVGAVYAIVVKLKEK